MNFILEPICAGIIYVVIGVSYANELRKLAYYRIKGIPYMKTEDKFHTTYNRTDR